MDNTVIRKLQLGDAGEINRIAKSITRDYDTTDFLRIVAIQTRSEDDISLVAEQANHLVAYCISYVLTGSFGIEKSAWLGMLGVDPQCMGQGIGEMLAKEVLKECCQRGIKDIYAPVRWDSTDLLSFFKTLGFQRSDFINLHKNIEY